MSSSRLPLAILAVVLFVALLTPDLARAHGSLGPAIAEVSRRIEAAPTDAALRLERAQLYRLDGEALLAGHDLDEAGRLLPGSKAVDLVRAAMLRDEGRLMAAERLLTTLVARAPDLGEAHAQRAEVLEALGRESEAVEALDSAIVHTRHPSPDPYLERARLVAAEGPMALDRALAGLDAGLAALGPVPALEERAAALEAAAGRLDAARARIDRLLIMTPGRAELHILHGDLFASAGRDVEAWADYSKALVLLEALPASRRNAPAMMALALRARRALDRSTTHMPTRGSRP